ARVVGRALHRAALVVARQHGEAIAAIHLRDHAGDEAARALEALTDHRLAGVDDDHVVLGRALGARRQLGAERERDVGPRVGGDLPLELDDLTILVAAPRRRRLRGVALV